MTTILGVTHIALRVADLRAAEDYYCRLFDLAVAWREAPTADGWRSLPPGKTWDDAERAGVRLELSLLYRGGLALALEAAQAVDTPGALSHIGIQLDEAGLAALRDRLDGLGCALSFASATTLVFDDAYGIRWEPTTLGYGDPPGLSGGARRGMWLAV